MMSAKQKERITCTMVKPGENMARIGQQDARFDKIQ